jgi:plastocyanin
MRSFLLFILLSLVACEGEPPKVPGGGAVPAAAAPPPEASAQPAAAPTAEAPAPAPEAPAPQASAAPGSGMCCCPCAAGAGAVADGGAPAVAPVPAPAPAHGGAPAVAPVPVPAPAAAPTTGSITGNVMSTSKTGLPIAVVYLEDAPVQPTAKMAAWIDNKKMTFTPYLAVVPIGGHVTFHNSDPFPHNVFSPDNERFSMGAIGQNQSMTRVFHKAGAYTLLCNLHPNMLGFLVVTPSSYYAKTDGKGHYTIKDVPLGTYKVTAWSPRLSPVTESVTVKGGEATVDFELHR